jgi:hypothetical protein
VQLLKNVGLNPPCNLFQEFWLLQWVCGGESLCLSDAHQGAHINGLLPARSLLGIANGNCPYFSYPLRLNGLQPRAIGAIDANDGVAHALVGAADKVLLEAQPYIPGIANVLQYLGSIKNGIDPNAAL